MTPSGSFCVECGVALRALPKRAGGSDRSAEDGVPAMATPDYDQPARLSGARSFVAFLVGWAVVLAVAAAVVFALAPVTRPPCADPTLPCPASLGPAPLAGLAGRRADRRLRHAVRADARGRRRAVAVRLRPAHLGARRERSFRRGLADDPFRGADGARQCGGPATVAAPAGRAGRGRDRRRDDGEPRCERQRDAREHRREGRARQPSPPAAHRLPASRGALRRRGLRGARRRSHPSGRTCWRPRTAVSRRASSCTSASRTSRSRSSAGPCAPRGTSATCSTTSSSASTGPRRSHDGKACGVGLGWSPRSRCPSCSWSRPVPTPAHPRESSARSPRSANWASVVSCPRRCGGRMASIDSTISGSEARARPWRSCRSTRSSTPTSRPGTARPARSAARSSGASWLARSRWAPARAR